MQLMPTVTGDIHTNNTFASALQCTGRLEKDMPVRYTLMNRNSPVLDFVYDATQHAALSVCAEHDLSLAPLAIWNERVARYATWDTLASLVGRWWTRRGIPESRTNLKMAKRLAGFDNPVQLTSATLGFSLTDQYWVRPEGSDLTWELGNFFLNDFDDGIGSILAGITDRPDTPSPVSPSATVDGNLPKMWHVDADDTRVLRKAGSGVLKQEPFNEVVATMLYRRLLLPSEYVAYRRETLGYGQYSICACFVRSDQEFVSARDIHLSLPGNDASPTRASLLVAAEALGVTDMAGQLDRVLTCDYILGNIDRHLGNLGALRACEGGDFKGCAPIFDSGFCLLCYQGDHDQDALAVLANPFLPRQAQQLALVQDLSWFDADALDGFADQAVDELAQCHSRYMDDERLAYLHAFIESGVRTVAELAHQPAVDPNNISQVEERAKEIDSLRMRFLANEGAGALFHVN